MMKSLLLLSLLALYHRSQVQACTCSPQTQQQALCESKWISHVQVLSTSTGASGGPDEGWITYQVKHVERFKVPATENGTKLALDEQTLSNIRTPALSPMCGVTDLEPKKEYLLAGTVAKAQVPAAASSSSGDNSTAAIAANKATGSSGGAAPATKERTSLNIITCLEVPLVDKQANNGTLEWADVTGELKTKLDDLLNGNYTVVNCK